MKEYKFLLGQQLTYAAVTLPNGDRCVYVCIHLKFYIYQSLTVAAIKNLQHIVGE